MDALDKPIGTHRPLRDADLQNRRIVLCVDDISRPTPTGQFFGLLLDYLLAQRDIDGISGYAGDRNDASRMTSP